MPKFLEVTNKAAAKRALSVGYINAVDYMANPADPATHSAGIQAAINAAAASNGTPWVVIPGGEWRCDNITIPARSPLRITGNIKNTLGVLKTNPDAVLSNPTVLVRTGANPIFKFHGPSSGSGEEADWVNMVRDVSVEHVLFYDSNPTATQPLVSLIRAQHCVFKECNFVTGSGNVGANAPQLEFYGSWDHKFYGCVWQGGANSSGVPQVWIHGERAGLDDGCQEIMFVNCENTNYFGPAFRLGDPGGGNGAACDVIQFANHKNESQQIGPSGTWQGAHYLVEDVSQLYLSNFYISHWKSPGPIMEIKKGQGIFGGLNFGQIYKLEQQVVPSELLKLGNNVADIDLDVYQTARTTLVPSNVVTMPAQNEPRTKIRVHGPNRTVNSKRQEFSHVESAVVIQSANSTNSPVRYVFAQDARVQWTIGNVSNPTGDQEVWTISAVGPTGAGAVEFGLFKIYDFGTAGSPSTARRQFEVNGSLNLVSPTQGFVWFENQSSIISNYQPGRPRLYSLNGVLTVDGSAIILNSGRNAANGFAGLDAGGKILPAQLPSSAMEYKGVWNASTNTPTLADGTGDSGDVYRVSVAGTLNLGAGSVSYEVGDLVIYDGSVWQRSDSTDAVTQVNGYTGTVTLTKADVGLGNADNTADANKSVASAATLVTGRTVQTNLASTSSATFNGSANVTPGVTGTLPVGNGGTGATTLTGVLKGNGTSALTAATGGTDFLETTDFDIDLASGENTLPRRMISNQTLGPGNNNLRLTYFTARRTETVSTVRVHVTTASTGSPTLVRIGVYSVAGNGDLTLVGSTANDTALFNTGGVMVTKALSASFTKTRGQRYAVGILVVGATTSAQLSGTGSLATSEVVQSPRLAGLVSSQTDLPATISAASVSDTFHNYYVALVP